MTRERNLGLTLDDVRGMSDTAYKRAFQSAAADRRITVREAGDLDRIKDYLGLTGTDIAATQSEFEHLRLLAEIEDCHLPISATPGLLLQKRENVHWSSPAQLLEERVVSRRYAGGSRGVSVRIMKGVTYRAGAHRGQIVRKQPQCP